MLAFYKPSSKSYLNAAAMLAFHAPSSKSYLNAAAMLAFHAPSSKSYLNALLCGTFTTSRRLVNVRAIRTLSLCRS
ncbi:hypothetical protein [Paenibacillus herberti]|uniref:hypothetical protein n=1 Tax=Paenibacillus herberti TaxID=1619309 RepID=UPI0011301242|nr:hypothetical protein [Paenibacillus herberti]